jgi:hypothetical protein
MILSFFIFSVHGILSTYTDQHKQRKTRNIHEPKRIQTQDSIEQVVKNRMAALTECINYTELLLYLSL